MAIWQLRVKVDGEKKQRRFLVDGAESSTEAINAIYDDIGGAGIDFEIVAVSKTENEKVIRVGNEETNE